MQVRREVQTDRLTDWNRGFAESRHEVTRSGYALPQRKITAKQRYPTNGRRVLSKSEKFGSGGRDRTYDQLINSQLLYR